MQNNLVSIRQQKSLQMLNSLSTKQPKPEITKAEAEVLIHKIASSSCSVFSNVVLLIKNGGHIALGFSKPQDCLRKKLPELSNSYVCRILKAKDLICLLDPKLEFLNLVSESTFRPLQDVEISDAILVWKLVTSTNQKRITARDIKKTMEKLGIKAHAKHVDNITISMDAELQHNVDRFVKRVSDSLLPTIQTKGEFKYFAKLIYMQLLKTCPISDLKN